MDLSKKKTAHTDIGRFAQDPVLQKTTAILDISIGTTYAAYGMGLIKNPGQFVPVNSQAAGGVLKAVGSNLRAVVYVGAGVIAGVLTAVIAAGGIRRLGRMVTILLLQEILRYLSVVLPVLY
ncbi:hypothetical protein [Aggregatibacter actinomycetemcomitans]|uniref:hypothetical protein n=1 Tax=Aggregatibacter actinomycetemcomitans TaxID=714 RepID=UPI0021CCB5D3|nr:hypothetical protein [Aggregatibacter actinomycetemcomitans]